MLEDQEKSVYLLFHGWTIENDPRECPPVVWIPPNGSLAYSICSYYLTDEHAFAMQKAGEK